MPFCLWCSSSLSLRQWQCCTAAPPFGQGMRLPLHSHQHRAAAGSRQGARAVVAPRWASSSSQATTVCPAQTASLSPNHQPGTHHLHLVDGRLDAGALEPLVRLPGREVADADAAHQALVHARLHGLPRLLPGARHQRQRHKCCRPLSCKASAAVLCGSSCSCVAADRLTAPSGADQCIRQGSSPARSRGRTASG